MMKKKKETTSQRVIIDNEIVSVSTLRKKAARANAVFWVACLLVALLSGMVVPYLSMAALSVNNSDAFTGEIIPGYSMGGIEVGAYGVDINEWGLVSEPTFTGSTYGMWDEDRTKQARDNFNKANVSNEQSSESVSATTKASVWESVTGRNSFSESAPNGTVDTPQSAQYDTVTPYRTPEETTYFMSTKPSVSANQDIMVTLYPDFVILSVDENGQVHALNNPDDATVSSTGSVLDRDSNGNVSTTTAVPVYVPLSAVLEKYELDTLTAEDGDLVSLDKLTEAIGDDARDHDGVAQKLTELVNDKNVNLLNDTSYANVNGASGEKNSYAFNPYPYSMVFQKSDDSGRLVTSSIYNNSEAYVYFSPASMYQAYISLKTEAELIASQATQEIANNDSVTAFQLGYYYAAMAICEAYLTEALPQDMTRGYVGASEDTAPQVQGDAAGTASVALDSVFGKSPSAPEDFANVTYATLMYDVAHQLSGGDEYCLGNTNAIMNMLSVFGYDNGTPNNGVGVMKGMDAETTYRRLTAFTPYEQSSGDYSGDDKGSQRDPNTLTSYTSGMYNAPYYPVQQHLMPDSEKSYRFSITSVIPYNTVTESIAYNGLGKSESGKYEIQTKLSYDSEFTQEFQSVTQYMTKAKALADQYDASSDEDSTTAPLQEYSPNTSTDSVTKRQVLIMGNASQEETAEQNEQQAMQSRVDSALMAYQSSTMDSDNVHDLCDVIRSVPGIKYETFMRFYNPLKSDGGDTDFFLTRVSPAMTDYFPVILNRGYENAGGIVGDLGTSGVAFDYFSIPSFAPCFASHTASTTYYGALNYELRAFYKKGFLETLSSSTNVQVPQLEDFQAAMEQLNELEDKKTSQEPVTKANIISLYVLAKRVIYADVIETMVANENSKTTISIGMMKNIDETDSAFLETSWIKRATQDNIDNDDAGEAGDITGTVGEGATIDTDSDSISDTIGQLQRAIESSAPYEVLSGEASEQEIIDALNSRGYTGSFTSLIAQACGDPTALNNDFSGVLKSVFSSDELQKFMGPSAAPNKPVTLADLLNSVGMQAEYILTFDNDDPLTAYDLAYLITEKYVGGFSSSGSTTYLTFDSQTLTDILKGRADRLGGDAKAFAQAVADGQVTSFTSYVKGIIKPGSNWFGDIGNTLGITNGVTLLQEDSDNHQYGTENYFQVFPNDGSTTMSEMEVDGNKLLWAMDIQLIYNAYYSTFYKEQLDSKDGKYFWDYDSSIRAYGKNPTGLDAFDDRELTEKFTVGYSTKLTNDILGDAMETREEYEKQIGELSQEIFKDVINLKQDMKLITDSMPSQMQNVLAWADYQNSSDSENQYQVDPSEANVTVNVGVETNVETGDSNDTILSQNDLADYGYSWDPDGEGGNGALVGDADIGSTNNAINEMNSRMARGVAGATWTSTIQPACYTMTAVTGRITSMNTDSDQNYPYYGIVNGRLQSGTDQYAILQAHVIDYSSIASGIAGDLTTRQRGQLIKVQDPDVGLFADIMNILNNIAGIFTEFGLSLIRFTGGLFEDLMFSSQMQDQIADVKNIDNSSELGNAFDLSRSLTASKSYTTLSAACTSSYVNMNRTPATVATFDTSTGELRDASMSLASAASTQIEKVGSSALLTGGYGLYSIIQSISLALVMVFLLIIAFQNFVAYSAGGQKEFIIAQTRLKTVLPRTIVAIFMIGLPPLGDGSVGFQGGCYLMLQFLSSIINTISSTFVTLSGGGMVDAWVAMVESMGTMDLGTLFVWLICAIIISACFLIGCATILVQSLILLVFWVIGPLVWAFYAWPYGSDPQRKEVSKPDGQHDHIGTMMWNITQKLHVGVFSRGAVGNAAPTAWAWSYVITASLTIVWSLMFWAMSLAVGTVDGGASATGTAAVLGTRYDAASSSVANAALFSMNQLGLSPWLQILLLTVMCVLIFWLMTRMMLSMFKNVPLSAAGLVPYMVGGIRHGMRTLGGLAVQGGGALADRLTETTFGNTPGSSDAKRRVGSMMRGVGRGMHAVGRFGHNRVNDAHALRDFAQHRAEDVANSPLGQLAHAWSQGGVDDRNRMSLTDAANAIEMRRINHAANENQENSDAVTAVAALQGRSKADIDRTLDKMAPEQRERLQRLGILSRNTDGEYAIDWAARERVERTLGDESRNIEQRREQLQHRNANLAPNAPRTQRTQSISAFVDADEFVPRVSERMRDENRRWREGNTRWNEDARIEMLQSSIPRDAQERVQQLVAAQAHRITSAAPGTTYTADQIDVMTNNFSRAMNAMTDLLPPDISDRDANRLQARMLEQMARDNGITMLSQADYERCAERVARGDALDAAEAASFSFMLGMSGTLSSTDKRVERQSENVQALMAATPVTGTQSGHHILSAQQMRRNYDDAQTEIQTQFMALHGSDLVSLVTTTGDTATEIRRVLTSGAGYTDIDSALENMIRTGDYNGDEIQGVLDGLHDRMREFQNDHAVVDPILATHSLNHEQFMRYDVNQSSDALVNDIALNNAVEAAMSAGQTSYVNASGATVTASAGELERAIAYMRDHDSSEFTDLQTQLATAQANVSHFDTIIHSAPAHSDLSVVSAYYNTHHTNNADRLTAVNRALEELDEKLADAPGIITPAQQTRRNTLRTLRDSYQAIEANNRLNNDRNMVSLILAQVGSWRRSSPAAFTQQVVRSRNAGSHDDDPRGNMRREESPARRNRGRSARSRRNGGGTHTHELDTT